MSRKAENLIVWAAVVIGGGYLIYRLFNQPQVAAPGVLPAPGANPAPGSIQQNLDTALTNLATGVTGIVGG